MIEEGLSNSEKRKGRQNYKLFQVFNVVSFTMLSGNVLTLFALKLGASNIFIGLISSIVYFAFIFMIVGRAIVSIIGTKRQFTLAWLLRNASMIPIVFAPVAARQGRIEVAMLLILLPFLGFNVFKGFGLVSVNPTLGAIAEGKDRGEFLSRLQIYVQSVLIGTNLVIALFVGSRAEADRYLILMVAGIGAGLVSAIFIARLPEPPKAKVSGQTKLLADIGDGLKRTDYRRFIILACVVALITGMTGPFLVVYAKQAYGIADNIVVLFLVVGNLGAIAMSIVTRKLIDRLGAKPLYAIFLGVLSISLILITISPNLNDLNNGFLIYVFFGALFFVFNFGLVGGTNAGQSYFFAVTNVAKLMNLGILFNVVGGISAAIGSIFAGALLGVLEVRSENVYLPFQLLYGIGLVLVFVCFIVLLGLKNNGRYSIRSALSVFLSRKDLRAVALLHKLDTTQTVSEEVEIIDTIANLDSTVPVEDLLERLKSPRFYIRTRALRALENNPSDPRITRAMLNEVKNHAFTTAHVAARILGRKGANDGLGLLRRSLQSPDYLLLGEAMLALARLGDGQSILRIEEILDTSDNPLVQIHAAAALEILSSIASIPALFRALKQSDPPPYLRDEIILSIAGITNMGDWFYPLYSQFLERARQGVSALIEAFRDCPVADEDRAKITVCIELLLSRRAAFGSQISAYFEALETRNIESAGAFALASRDVDLLKFDRIAFLLAASAVFLCWNPEGGSN